MDTFRLTRLLPLFLLITIGHGVQMSELVGTSSFFGPYLTRVFSDGTQLVSGFSGSRSYKELKLHPIVTVPNPSEKLASTILLARVHPKNSTVIWATAITTMDIDVGVIVDTQDNVYAAADVPYNSVHPEDTITIIKHNPSGVRIWEKFYTPEVIKKLDKSNVLYSINENGFPRSSILSFIPRSTLVVSVGAKKGSFGNPKPALLLFNSRNGRFLRSKLIAPPREARIGFIRSSLAVTASRKGPKVCYAFEGNTDAAGSIDKFYATCSGLGKKSVPRTRQIDETVNRRDFFFVKSVVMERTQDASRPPSFFVTYERVLFKPGGDIQELFIRRLDSNTLRDVSWATGKPSKTARPIVILLPKRRPVGNTHITFPYSMLYSTKARSVAVVLWTGTPFKEFVPEPRGGGKITAVEDTNAPDLPVQHWVFFFDQKRQLHPELISTDLEHGPEEAIFSLDEKCVLLSGFPFVEAVDGIVSNPLVEGKC